MTNFETLDRMKGLVSFCICNTSNTPISRSFGDGGHVYCGKKAECPREDVQIHNKCNVWGKRNIKSIFSYIPKPIRVSKKSSGVEVKLHLKICM